MELLTAAEMRAIEQAAIDSGEVTGLELMERAGRGVVEAVFDQWPELAAAPGRTVVLCGPGNNGGDGFVVARLLREKGWVVEVYLYGDEAKLPPDAAENCRRWRELGEVAPLDSSTNPWRGDLMIDALFGTGLTRPLGGAAAELAEELRKCAGLQYDVAIDAPSGVCMDSGRPLGPAFHAELTVAFHRPKIGHYLGEGAGRFGALHVVDIGLPQAWARGAVSLVAPAVPGLSKSSGGHKYAHGHAVILSGDPGKGGAARLAARGALRIGAGLVTIAAPPEAIAEHAARLDAVMLRSIANDAALAEMLEDARLNAVVLGPGLGVGATTRAMSAAALAGEGRGVVLDADALTSFAGAPEDLFALTMGKRAILTPHMGEFARLFPDIAANLTAPPERGPAYSKVDATREAAARAGCVVLLKGPDTVIADADGRGAIASAQYQRACPWLATAGAGDVLAGMIGGLLARGFDPRTAAETGAWLHQEAARKFGPGLIAEDLPEQLPAIFRDLGV